MPLCYLLNIDLLFMYRLILIVSFSYLATLPVDSRLVNDITIIPITQADTRVSFHSSLSLGHHNPVSRKGLTHRLLKCLGIAPL